MDWDIEYISDAYFRFDRIWRLQTLNSAAAELIQRPADDLRGKTFDQAFPNAVGSLFENRFRLAMRTGRTVRFQAKFHEGESVQSIACYPDPDGFQVLCRDVTDEVQRHQDMRQSHDFLRELVENLPAGAVMVDPENSLVLNRKAEWILGRSKRDLPTLHEFFQKVGGRRAERLRRAYLRGKQLGFPESLTLKIDRPDGSACYVEIAAHAGSLVEVWMLYDVTQRVRAEQKLRRANLKIAALADRDGLTGLLNRRALDHLLEKECERCRSLNQPLSLLMGDIDHFKEYNDSFGHLCGDQVLKTAGPVFERITRPLDFVGRYGGEEFIIGLPGAGFDEASAAADRLREAFAEVAWTHRQLTISIGVATRCGPALDPLALVSEADEALYRAKAGGRNRIARAVISSL